MQVDTSLATELAISLLAALGLYGVMSFLVLMRTKEKRSAHGPERAGAQRRAPYGPIHRLRSAPGTL